MLHNTGVPATSQPTADSARLAPWRPRSDFWSTGVRLCNFTSTLSCVPADVHGALNMGYCAVWVDYFKASPLNTNRQWSIFYIKDVMTCRGVEQAMVTSSDAGCATEAQASTMGTATFSVPVRVTCSRQMLDLVHLHCVQRNSSLVISFSPLADRCCILLTGIDFDGGDFLTGFLHARDADAVDPLTLRRAEFSNCQRTCELCHKEFPSFMGYRRHHAHCFDKRVMQISDNCAGQPHQESAAQASTHKSTVGHKSVYLETRMFALDIPVTMDSSRRAHFADKYLFVCGGRRKQPFVFGGLQLHQMRDHTWYLNHRDHVCIQYPQDADFKKYLPNGARDADFAWVLKTDVQLLDMKYAGCVRYLAIVHSKHLLQDSVRYALLVDLCEALAKTNLLLGTQDVLQLPERHALTLPLSDSSDAGRVDGWFLRVRRESTKRRRGSGRVGGALYSHVEPNQHTIDVLQQALVPNPQLLSVDDMKIYIALIENTVSAVN